MSLLLRSEYWDDSKARSAFKDFALEIFGLDFSEWESGGFWDNAYTPFSFFDGGKIVSSVCVYLLDAVIDGRRTRLAQLSAVGTLPGLRKRGLSRELTDVGLEWARGKQEGIFLFATSGAVPYYEACGFRPIEERLEYVEAEPVSKRDGAIRLDPGKRSDLQKIYRYARRRAPISNRFAVLNPRLVAFHALHSLRNLAYEISDLGCVLFMERKDDCLKIYDILGERIPAMKELYPFIADRKERRVEFHFFTDRLRLDSVRTRSLTGNNPFVKDSFPVADPVFPFTARA